MNNLFKKFVAELLGTFVLVFAACGTASWTKGDPVATSLAFGLSIIAMAYSIGRISGCHINPAVSLGCFLTKRMTAKEFGIYVCAQIVGGLLGAIAIFGLFKMGNVTNIGDACNYAVGFVPDAGATISPGGACAAIIAEVILTCIFVCVILNVTDAKNNSIGKKAGLIIGFTLVLVHLVGIGLTGTSVNPARSIATAFASLIFDGDVEPLTQVWIFIVAPLAGGALASCFFNILHKDKATDI